MDGWETPDGEIEMVGVIELPLLEGFTLRKQYDTKVTDVLEDDFVIFRLHFSFEGCNDTNI